jgi:hypothetical protein
MNVNDLILIVERLGLPAVMFIIGTVILWQSMKQSSKRDGANFELQKQQNKILEKLSDRIHDNHDDIQTAVDGIKRDLEGLLKANHSEAMTTVKTIIDKVDGLPTIFSDAQKDYDNRIKSGFGAFLTEIKTTIETLVKQEGKAKDEKNTSGIVNVGSPYLRDGD